MGCGSVKKTTLQQKVSQPTKMQEEHEQPRQETGLLISQLFSLLVSQQLEPEQKPQLLKLKLGPEVDKNCNRISCFLEKKLSPGQSGEGTSSDLKECIIVCDEILKHTGYFKGFQRLGSNQLNQLALFIESETDGEVLDSFVHFVENLYLEHGNEIYSKTQSIFKVLIMKFSEYRSDSIREVATQILVQMLVENKRLLKYANQPYHFLQFWLYLINEQTQLDRQLYWIECVKKVYASDKSAEDSLFYDSDFRVFVDLLVRVIEKCPDGKSLRVPLECYLVLSCTEKMRPSPHRVADIKDYLCAINGETLGIVDLVNEMNSLK